MRNFAETFSLLKAVRRAQRKVGCTVGAIICPVQHKHLETLPNVDAPLMGEEETEHSAIKIQDDVQ